VTFKDHFSSHATDYASFRPTYPPELVDYLATLTREHDEALDVGCGTGQLSTMLPARYAHVTATDASAEQIAKASPHPQVTYAARPADASGLQDRSVDLITVAQAAHWFDLPSFYAEARRIAKADSALVLVTYGITQADGRLGELIDDFYHRVVGPFWPAERKHVESGYRDLPFPFAELAAPPLFMRAQWSAAQLLGYVSTWSAIRPAEKQLGREPIVAFNDEVTAVMGNQRTEIRWPLALRVGRLA
jgi:SAM-dependent methyltransferase